MQQSMMLPVLPAGRPDITMEPALEIVYSQESATAFRQMDDAFRYLRFCLRMNVFMIVSIA